MAVHKISDFTEIRKCSEQALSDIYGVKFHSENDGQVFRAVSYRTKALEPIKGDFRTNIGFS